MMTEMDDKTRTSLLRRLSRAEGQMGAVRRMIEEGTDCADVLLQIAAVRGALGKIGRALLESHMETCVSEGLAGDDDERRRERIDELVEVFSRFAGMTSR